MDSASDLVIIGASASEPHTNGVAGGDAQYRMSMRPAPGEKKIWTHFRLSLWRELLLRMRSVNCHGNVQMN